MMTSSYVSGKRNTLTSNKYKLLDEEVLSVHSMILTQLQCLPNFVIRSYYEEGEILYKQS